MNGIDCRRFVSAIVGAAGFLAILPPAEALSAAPPLRHHLEVGDHLVYERRVRVIPLEGPSETKQYRAQLQLWCLARDQDEFFVYADITRVVGSHAGPSRGAPFHVDSRGRRRFSREILPRIAGFDPIFELIPILPPAIEEAPTWQSEPDQFGRRLRCTRAAADPSGDGTVRVDFVLEDPTGVTAASDLEQRGAFWFDRDSSTVVRVETETRDTRNRRRILAVTQLHARMKQNHRWCDRRLEELELYQRALRLEDRLLERIATEPGQVEENLSSIRRLWTELLAQLPRSAQSPVRRLVQVRAATLHEDAARCRERAELTRRWLGSTAAHWSLQTPDGESIRSEAMRDRIVIECFWSADSLASLRSFEILRDLQQQLPAESFRVICLNIDPDADAGRRAARLGGVGLTHVLSGPPVGGQPPEELPIFRVLDRDSHVLAVYFGWQPWLTQKIAALEVE